jgi:hypothetical protein
MAVAACSATTGSAAAEPQLTIREQCPSGVVWTATGLRPGAVVDYVWSFGGGLGGAADVVTQADSNGTVGPKQLQLPSQRVKFVSVSLRAVFPSDAPVPAVARLKKPCKHAD